MVPPENDSSADAVSEAVIWDDAAQTYVGSMTVPYFSISILLL